MSGVVEWFNYVSTQMAPALLLGAITAGALGAIVLAVTWLWDSRRRTVEALLRDGFAIHASLEAWILESSGKLKLSENRSLKTDQGSDNHWLRPVEVRAVLDQSSWNAPEQNFYGFINGRRAWIVRDEVTDDTYLRPKDVQGLKSYPALLSSRALHELAGWIERIASLCIWRIWPPPRQPKPIGFFLPKQVVRSLWPILDPLRADDRIKVLSSRLSPEAKVFLQWRYHL